MFDYLSILTYSKGSEKARTKAKVDAFGATHYQKIGSKAPPFTAALC